MQYLASHWQSADENSPSLLLQQVYHKQKQLPVLMACVCGNTQNPHLAKELITMLADWFYEAGLPLAVKRGERGIVRIRKNLEMYLEHYGTRKKEKLAGVELSGVFCIENSLFLWKKGEASLWLLNQRNGNAQITELHPEESHAKGIVFQNGFMQKEVGLLLATKSYGPPKPVNVKGLKERSRMEDYLKKWSTEAAAAVLLVTG